MKRNSANANDRLVAIARTLPERSRVGLALIAADKAVERLRRSPNFAIGKAAFDLARQWYDEQSVSPTRIEESIHDENDEGVDLCAQEAQSAEERAAWLVLEDALYYTAFHGYRVTGEHPGPIVSETTEEAELRYLDENIDALSPDIFMIIAKAAEQLRLNPHMSFAQLKAAIAM
jgi:hypothetical protein